MRFEAHWETTASPDKVWEVLADGWRYPGWVVGASRMRAVDPAWPAPGARIHHSVGLWPFLIDDHTEVLEEDPGKSLTLLARAKAFAGPDRNPGPPRRGGSVIEMGEHLASPPMSVVSAERRRRLAAVPAQPECIRRLALLAEGPALRATDRPHRGSGDR
ncbi:SRPBCC family protein [Rhodococcus hoagii]|nr:SRPBCC family protein [Prescottella equi]